MVRVLVLVAFPSTLRSESFWSYPIGEVGVLLDLCGGAILHDSKVYLTAWFVVIVFKSFFFFTIFFFNLEKMLQ